MFSEFLKSNLFSTICLFIAALLLLWSYGCESKVKSLYDSSCMISRPELQAEVEMFLQKAESRYRALDRQDQLRQTLLEHLAVYSSTGSINPLGVLMSILGVLGSGAIVDNVRRRKSSTSSNSTS